MKSWRNWRKAERCFPVTTMMEEGRGPEEILEEILGKFDLVINENLKAGFIAAAPRSTLRGAHQYGKGRIAEDHG